MRRRVLLTFALIFTALSGLAQSVTVLRNATIVPEPGQRIERADILIRDGVIVDIGPNLTAPSVAKEFDCKGLTVYAGFVHPALAVSVDELGAAIEKDRENDSLPNDLWNRRDNLLTRYSLASFSAQEVSTLRSFAEAGYGVAHVYDRRGVVGPRSALLSLASGSLSGGAILTKDVAVPISLSRGGFGFGAYPGSLMGRIAFVRQALTDIGWHDRVLRRYEANPSGLPRPARDLDYEAATPLLRGDQFALFDNLDKDNALRSLSLVRSFGLKPILVFDSGAGWIADTLAQMRGLVALSGRVPSKPRLDDEDDRNDYSAVVTYFNEVQAGAELERKGIRFAYAPSSSGSALEGIRTYVAAGLSRDAALASMTTVPASALGVERQVGKVAKGYLANLVVVEGDLFAPSGRVVLTIHEGKPSANELPKRRDSAELKPATPMKLMPPDYSVFPRPAETKPAFRLFKNATVWTMSSAGILTGADVLIRDGKIVAVGKNLQAPAGCEVVDATGLHISPGILDAHSHTAITGGVNEGSNLVTIECRIQDVINPDDVNIYRQLAGGTVGALMLHGSANPIGGQSITVKWRWGQPAEKFPIEGAPPGVKFALGQNPIREDEGRRRGEEPAPATDRPRTRMGVMDTIRKAFDDALDYRAQWDAYRKGLTKVEPRKNLQLEAILEVLDGKRKIHSHGYRSDELLALLRLAEQYGIRVATLQHVLEGYKIADEMAKHGVGGSTFADWWGYKLEAYDAIPENAAMMWERGVVTSVNSDSNDQARRLNFEAAKSIRYGGVSPEVALSFVTIQPAKQLGIDRWTGSIEPGKDADIVLWSAPPTSVFARCLQTYVDGVKLFDVEHDRAERERRLKVLEEAKKLLSEEPAESDGSAKTEDDGAEPPTALPLPAIKGQPGNSRYPRKPVVIAGATIHPMTGAPFTGDVLIGPDGRIAAVGKVQRPKDAAVVNGSGKHLYPGMIDPNTTLGLTEIGQVPVSDDTSERGDFNARLQAAIAINPTSETIGVARAAGILTAVSAPTGGTVSGQAALISLDGFTWEDLVYTPSFALVLNVGASERALEQMDEWIRDAREYRKQRQAAAAGQIPPVDVNEDLEAVEAVADGKMPLIVSVSTPSIVEKVINWCTERKISFVLVGGPELVEVADLLAKTQTPVAISGTTGVPSGEDPYDYDYTAPAKLRAAGVKFCFTTRDAHNVRYLRDLAGFAAAWGMDPLEAERAVTLYPAEILGLGDRLGSIEVGKEGTLILMDGPILETGSKVERAWIQGRELQLVNRQTILRDLYRSRPRLANGGK